ncbi:C-C motif chemokine 27 [Lissotriton helveticus]
MMKAPLFFCVLTLVLPSLGGMPGRPPPCCTELATTFHRHILKHVQNVTVQNKDGVCNIKAVLLHFKRRKVCVDAENHSLLTWLCTHKRHRKICSLLTKGTGFPRKAIAKTNSH